jgi:hypothetical protein
MQKRTTKNDSKEKGRVGCEEEKLGTKRVKIWS